MWSNQSNKPSRSRGESVMLQCSNCWSHIGVLRISSFQFVNFLKFESQMEVCDFSKSSHIFGALTKQIRTTHFSQSQILIVAKAKIKVPLLCFLLPSSVLHIFCAYKQLAELKRPNSIIPTPKKAVLIYTFHTCNSDTNTAQYRTNQPFFTRLKILAF